MHEQCRTLGRKSPGASEPICNVNWGYVDSFTKESNMNFKGIKLRTIKYISLIYSGVGSGVNE